MSVVEDLLLRFQAIGFREAKAEVDAAAGSIHRVDKHSKEAQKSTVGLGRAFGGLKGMASNAAGMVGIAGLAFGIADAVRHAQHLQEVQAQLGASLHANVRTPAHDATEEMTKFADSMSEHGGFTPTESIYGMTQFLRVTKNVERSQGDMTLATNIARGAHVSLSRAIRAVTLLEQGRTQGLSKLGISIPKVTTAYDHLRDTHKHATREQIAAAKATDALAAKQNAMANVSKQYSGAMATYSKTSSGGISNLRNSVEVLSAKLGALLLPAVNWIVGAFVKMVDPLGKIMGYLKPLLPLVGALAGAFALYKTQVMLSAIATGVMESAMWGNVTAAIALIPSIGSLSDAWIVLDGVMSANPIGVVVLAIGVLVGAFILAYKHVKWFRDAMNATWSWMKNAAGDAVGAVVDAWHWLSHAATQTAHWVVNAFHNVVHFFSVTIPHVFEACVDTITGAWNGLVKWFARLPGRIGSALATVGKVIASPFVAAYNWVHKELLAIYHDAKWVVDHIVSFFKSLPGRIVSGLGNIGSRVGGAVLGIAHHIPLIGGLLPGKAAGGPITQSGPFLVGERGPEVVTLPRGSYVTPNDQLGGQQAQQPIVIYNILDGKIMSQSVIRQGLLQQSRGG